MILVSSATDRLGPNSPDMCSAFRHGRRFSDRHAVHASSSSVPGCSGLSYPNDYVLHSSQIQHHPQIAIVSLPENGSVLVRNRTIRTNISRRMQSIRMKPVNSNIPTIATYNIFSVFTIPQRMEEHIVCRLVCIHRKHVCALWHTKRVFPSMMS